MALEHFERVLKLTVGRNVIAGLAGQVVGGAVLSGRPVRALVGAANVMADGPRRRESNTNQSCILGRMP